jgi:hypothetical protein
MTALNTDRPMANRLTILHNEDDLCKVDLFVKALLQKVKALKPGYTVVLQKVNEQEEFKQSEGQPVFLYFFVSSTRHDPGDLLGRLGWFEGTLGYEKGY